MDELWKAAFDALDATDRRLLAETSKAERPELYREARGLVVASLVRIRRAAFLTRKPQ